MSEGLKAVFIKLESFVNAGAQAEKMNGKKEKGSQESTRSARCHFAGKKKIEDLKTKLKDYRKSGLDKDGELSYENLTFKFLRRNGMIEMLRRKGYTVTPIFSDYTEKGKKIKTRRKNLKKFVTKKTFEKKISNFF